MSDNRKTTPPQAGVASMTQDAPAHPDAVLDEVVTALRRDDPERAERALAAAPGVVGPEAFLRLAELNVRRRRWRDATWLFDRVPDREPAAELKRCLARNMAALQRRRPTVYAALADLPPRDRQDAVHIRP